MASVVPRPLPDLSCSRGEPIFLEGGEIKSGSGLGMRLAVCQMLRRSKRCSDDRRDAQTIEVPGAYTLLR